MINPTYIFYFDYFFLLNDHSITNFSIWYCSHIIEVIVLDIILKAFYVIPTNYFFYLLQIICNMRYMLFFFFLVWNVWMVLVLSVEYRHCLVYFINHWILELIKPIQFQLITSHSSVFWWNLIIHILEPIVQAFVFSF